MDMFSLVTSFILAQSQPLLGLLGLTGSTATVQLAVIFAITLSVLAFAAAVVGLVIYSFKNNKETIPPQEEDLQNEPLDSESDSELPPPSYHLEANLPSPHLDAQQENSVLDDSLPSAYSQDEAQKSQKSFKD